MSTTGKSDLVDLSNEVWQRTRSRLDGMSDAEYLWEPTPGSWTIRLRSDGHWRADIVAPQPDPEPFTTIAWRLWHLIDMYGENRAPRWLGVAPQGPAIGLDDPDGTPPATAGEAVRLLERAHERWHAHLSLASDDSLGELVGSVGGPYADRTRASYVLHMLDEFIHHGAEIALLRDLWRWQQPVNDDALVERVIRGDRSVLSDVAQVDDAMSTRLLGVAASYARWDLVRDMIGVGVPVATEGRTPLHQAAAAGELDVVQLLVAAGADIALRDPDYGATALEWARFGDRGPTAAWLVSQL